MDVIFKIAGIQILNFIKNPYNSLPPQRNKYLWYFCLFKDWVTQSIECFLYILIDQATQVVFGFLKMPLCWPIANAIFFRVKGKSIEDALAVFQIVLERVLGWFLLSLQYAVYYYFSNFFSPLLCRKWYWHLKNLKTSIKVLCQTLKYPFLPKHLNSFWWPSPFNSIDSFVGAAGSGLQNSLLPRLPFYHARSKYQFSNQPDSGKNSGEQVLQEIRLFLEFSWHIRSKIPRGKQKVQNGIHCRQKLVKNCLSFSSSGLLH